VALRRGVAVEVALERIAERDDPEQLAPGKLALAAGIELLDRAAQLGKVLPDARLLVAEANGRARIPKYTNA